MVLRMKFKELCNYSILFDALEDMGMLYTTFIMQHDIMTIYKYIQTCQNCKILKYSPRQFKKQKINYHVSLASQFSRPPRVLFIAKPALHFPRPLHNYLIPLLYIPASWRWRGMPAGVRTPSGTRRPPGSSQLCTLSPESPQDGDAGHYVARMCKYEKHKKKK